MYPRPINESLEQAQHRESLEAERQARRDAMARFLPPEDEPQPDTCHECGELAVGYSEGTPYCAAHYRTRFCLTDCGDGSTVYDDRPRPGAIDEETA